MNYVVSPTLDAAQLLSPLPLFDEALATAVLGLRSDVHPGESPSDPSESSSDIFERLVLSGLVSRYSDLMRVSDPIRISLIKEFRQADSAKHREVLLAFDHAARNGLQDRLVAVLGQHATTVQIAVLGLMAKEGDSREPLDTLLAAVRTSFEAGRTGDADAAARLLASEGNGEFNRQSLLLSGLAHWERDDFANAVDCFTRILLDPVADSATAISAHLSAVYEAQKFDMRSALNHARQAVQVLDQLGDELGLSMALTTLGRIESEAASQQMALYESREPARGPSREESEASELASSALVHLERAVGLTQGRDWLGSRSQVELAKALAKQGFIEEADDVAADAEAALSLADPRYLDSLIDLASVLRTTGNYDGVRRLLSIGMEHARSRGELIRIARMLNVLASAERRLDRRDLALVHASESVRIGRVLNDRAHLSHALHTLGAVLADPPNTREDLAQAETLLLEARSLHSSRDAKGLRMIDRTTQRVRQQRG
jgi:tetratricopeptide (TPR) repeat protein